MAHLNNDIIQCEAVLTKRGKELLSKSTGEFNITKFALADDGIDYNLWNEFTTDNLKGIMIESTPILEPIVDENYIMINKLITLPKGTVRIPIINVGQTNISLSSNQSYTITPTVTNYDNGNEVYGYTAILLNSSVAEIRPATGYQIDNYTYNANNNNNITTTIIAKRFELIAKNISEEQTTKIIIIGNETGGRIEINLIVKSINNTINNTIQ